MPALNRSQVYCSEAQFIFCPKVRLLQQSFKCLLGIGFGIVNAKSTVSFTPEPTALFKILVQYNFPMFGKSFLKMNNSVEICPKNLTQEKNTQFRLNLSCRKALSIG